MWSSPISPGASVPADGEIVDGQSSLNESMITGESRPVKKSEGDKVIAGTINGDGSLRIKVTATGEVKSDGLRGEQVKVVNLDSNKRFSARVVDKKKTPGEAGVRIRFHGIRYCFYSESTVGESVSGHPA